MNRVVLSLSYSHVWPAMPSRFLTPYPAHWFSLRHPWPLIFMVTKNVGQEWMRKIWLDFRYSRSIRVLYQRPFKFTGFLFSFPIYMSFFFFATALLPKISLEFIYFFLCLSIAASIAISFPAWCSSAFLLECVSVDRIPSCVASVSRSLVRALLILRCQGFWPDKVSCASVVMPVSYGTKKKVL
jgi:hypothetical protein